MINVVGSNYQAVSYHLDSSYTHLTVTCQEVERQKIIYQDQYERSLDLNHFIQKIENFFFYLGFLSRTFTIRRTQVDRRDNKSSSLSPLYLFHALHRLLPCDYCRELTAPHSQQPSSSWEPLISERKSPTTKLCTKNQFVAQFWKQQRF